MHHLASFLNHFFIAVNHHCLPNHCHHCDTPISVSSGTYALCLDCQTQCQPNLSTIDTQPIAVHALFEFSGVIQTLMHSLKFDCNLATIDYLMPPTIKLPTADVIIPVPSHPSRIRHRGFDHVECLFKSHYTHRYYPCIQRIKKTPPLYKKTAKKRKKILKNAFQWSPRYTHNCDHQSILIVDDIYTSGSTLAAIIECITRHCTPKRIEAFALCRKL